MSACEIVDIRVNSVHNDDESTSYIDGTNTYITSSAGLLVGADNNNQALDWKIVCWTGFLMKRMK